MYFSLKMYFVSVALILSSCLYSPVIARTVAAGVLSAAVAAAIVLFSRTRLSQDLTLVWHRSRAFWLHIQSL